MKPPIILILTFGLGFAAVAHAATDQPHHLEPAAPRTVTVSEADTPPAIRAGLLQSTLIMLPAEEKVANVFAGDTVTQLGLTELSCIALFTLVSMSINWSTTGMSFRLHQDHVHVGDLTNFLMKLIICCLLENYWVNPFPGASFGINHFFSYIAQAMVRPVSGCSKAHLSTT